VAVDVLWIATGKKDIGYEKDQNRIWRIQLNEDVTGDDSLVLFEKERYVNLCTRTKNEKSKTSKHSMISKRRLKIRDNVFPLYAPAFPLHHSSPVHQCTHLEQTQHYATNTIKSN
jgi:hypothetical protein